MNRIQITSVMIFLSAATLPVTAKPVISLPFTADPLAAVRAAAIKMRQQPLARSGHIFAPRNLTSYEMARVTEVHKVRGPHQEATPLSKPEVQPPSGL